MAGSAVPDDVERLVVVGVVHLAVRVAALFTGCFGELPSFEVDVGVGPGVRPSALFAGGGMLSAPGSHEGCVAADAGALPGTRWPVTPGADDRGCDSGAGFEFDFEAVEDVPYIPRKFHDNSLLCGMVRSRLR